MPAGCSARAPADQAGVARRGVGDPPGVPGRVHRDIQVIAGDVQAEIRGLGHFGTLPCGARPPAPPCKIRARHGGPGNGTGSGPAPRAGTTTLPIGLLGPRGGRSVPARCLPPDNPRVLQHTRGGSRTALTGQPRGSQRLSRRRRPRAPRSPPAARAVPARPAPWSARAPSRRRPRCRPRSCPGSRTCRPGRRSS